jgi:hypothetical protein
MNPENRPWQVRASAMCQGWVAATMISVVTVAKNRARMYMSFRPCRSDSTPQTGPATSRAIPCPAIAMLTQNRAFASLVAPSSRM